MTTIAKTEYAVELSGLTKRYGREDAVSDLTLRIPRGAALGFLGPNGAGKTTTIKALMGLVKRDAGEVHVLSFDPAVSALAVRQRVGYVPEQHFIYRWMRVRQVVDFCRVWYPKWNNKLCAELLQLFRLDPEKKVKHLSKGMVVKLALVLALAHEPELLILDEPMAGLDPIAREELLDGVLRSICERERTILFSSHTLSDVQRIAERIAIIHHGRLLLNAPVDDLLAGTKRIRVVLANGSVPQHPPSETIWERVREREWLLTVGNFTPEVVQRLKAANDVAHVEVIELGLEDIFKDYIRGWRAPV